MPALTLTPTVILRTGLSLLLAGGAMAAQAGGSVGIGLQLGHALPVAGVVGTVGVQVGSGHRGLRGHRGHRGYRGHGGHGHWRHGWGASLLWVAPPLVWAATPWPDAPLPPATEPPPVSVLPTRPDPVISPAQGQGAQQAEYDRQQCNRWATTQPAAMADAGVFHQTALACLRDRGYAVD